MFQPTKQNNSVIKVEVLFQGFVIEHNSPLAINDYFSKLASDMFPDSEIVWQYPCGRTKSTHMTYAIASDSINTMKQEVATSKSSFC